MHICFQTIVRVFMLEYDFMQRAFIAGILIAILSAISGTFVVLKRYSLIGETLSHASLVGVSVALVAGYSPLWMAVLFALIASWAIEYLRESFGLYSDAVLSIVLSGSLSLAVIIVSVGGGLNTSLFSYLFGSILSVSTEDIYTILIVGFVALLFLVTNAKKLYFIAYDEEVAKTSGIDVRMLNFILVSVIAIVIALSIRVVGSLLIGALIVIPTTSALLYKVGFYKTMLYSLLFAVVSVVGGISISYYFSTPSGATIVLFVIAIFIFSLLVNKKR